MARNVVGCGEKDVRTELEECGYVAEGRALDEPSEPRPGAHRATWLAGRRDRGDGVVAL